MLTPRTRHGFAAVLIGALLLVSAGCSSGGSESANSTNAASDIETTDEVDSGNDGEAAASDGDGEAAAKPTEAECQELLQGRPRYVTAANQLTVLDDPDALELALGDTGLDKLEAYIALLRPYQDVEGEVFGSLREGLDNAEADIAAIREGRYDELVGDYNSVAVVPVLEELGC